MDGQNCAIKPPLSTALRERHRRLCVTCAKAPIAALASPALDPSLGLDSEAVQRAVCQCDTEGVWLCQPCGHSIRNADHDYKGYVLAIIVNKKSCHLDLTRE
jgi:hypothetical protein